MIGGASSVFFLCKLFASGTVTGKPFQLFDVTMEITRGKFNLKYNSKTGYTKKSSYPRVTNDFPETKSSSVTTANIISIATFTTIWSSDKIIVLPCLKLVKYFETNIASILLGPVVQNPFSSHPWLTLNKTYRVKPGLALIWLCTADCANNYSGGVGTVVKISASQS